MDSLWFWWLTFHLYLGPKAFYKIKSCNSFFSANLFKWPKIFIFLFVFISPNPTSPKIVVWWNRLQRCSARLFCRYSEQQHLSNHIHHNVQVRVLTKEENRMMTGCVKKKIEQQQQQHKHIHGVVKTCKRCAEPEQLFQLQTAARTVQEAGHSHLQPSGCSTPLSETFLSHYIS